MVTITQNNHGTLFVAIGGRTVADSACIRRQRGFYNHETKQYVPAPKFTPRRARKEPGRVLALLDMTGTDVSGLTLADVVWA